MSTILSFRSFISQLNQGSTILLLNFPTNWRSANLCSGQIIFRLIIFSNDSISTHQMRLRQTLIFYVSCKISYRIYLRTVNLNIPGSPNPTRLWHPADKTPSSYTRDTYLALTFIKFKYLQ